MTNSIREEFNNYIEELSNQSLKNDVKIIWALLNRDYNIIIPQAGFAEYMNYFQLAFDKQEHHFNIDFNWSDTLSQFSLEWFYRNRQTDKVDGGDNLDDMIKEYLIHFKE